MAPIEAGKYAPEGLIPGIVALRELDGLPFDVLILRVRGDEADVLYLDDLNIEREVPLEEIDEASDETRIAWSPERLAGMLEEGLLVLAADGEADANARPTTADMRWDQGRYVGDDGSVFLSTGADVMGIEAPKDEVPKDEVPKNSCASGYSACGAGLRGIRSLRKGRPQAPPCPPVA